MERESSGEYIDKQLDIRKKIEEQGEATQDYLDSLDAAGSAAAAGEADRLESLRKARVRERIGIATQGEQAVVNEDRSPSESKGE